jgi:hypothetical protein
VQKIYARMPLAVSALKIFVLVMARVIANYLTHYKKSFMNDIMLVIKTKTKYY